MASLNEKQLKSLSTLWAAISPELRVQLKSAAGSSGKLAEVFAIIDGESEADTEVPDYDTVLFRIFADVTGTQDQPPTHSRFSSEQLKKIKELTAPDSHDQPAESDDAAMQTWRSKIAESLSVQLQRSQSEKDVLRRLKGELGNDFEALLGDAQTLLENDQILHAALQPFPEAIADLSPDLVDEARDAHETICNDAPDASLWFLKILTARLKKTPQIFRVVEKIGRKSDDSLVSKTDLADIGDLVLANAAFYADRLTKAPQTLEEAEAAGTAVAEFVRISVGMTREFGIRKDGDWGKTLFGIRAKASAALEEFFRQFEQSFPRALPQPAKGQRGLAKAGTIPEPAIIEQAEAALCLLAATADWATQAAVASPQKHAADLARNELDKCGRNLLEILRTAEDDDKTFAVEALALVVRYMRAFEDDENADLIQRRSAAVQANAA
ncbi:hypothetical protein [Hyphobacterium sp.]|uniref:hypothetical protein n=1 Tax=Hyphobacterium sp. TaxID=2004662 RepID=UPI003B521DE1